MDNAKVLVVEDDVHLLGGIRDILEMYGYAVLTAQNGKDALEVLHNTQTRPDIIVSDIMMPLMNGFELLEEVRKEDAWITIPFIFLTAKGERADILRGRKLGVDVYLTKPFDPEELLVAVSTRLERQRRLSEIQSGQISDIKKNIMTVLNHEFRTPLTLIVAYAEMVKEYENKEMSDEELMNFLKGVSSGADRLRRLVENFILLVELDNGDLEKTYAWRQRPIEDIEDLLTFAMRQVFNAENVEHQCEIEIEPGLPPLLGDREFLVIAIRELLHNAVKFSEPDRPIRMSARVDGDMLCIAVQDFGRGIPEDEFENIWKRFYQVDRKMHEDQGGGSGLAIVHGIVLLHGGEVGVESTVGESTTFTLSLPVMKDPV